MKISLLERLIIQHIQTRIMVMALALLIVMIHTLVADQLKFSMATNTLIAVIIAFDNDGKIIWDNSFEINDLKSFQLQEHIQLAFLKNEIVMLYLYDQQLKIKVIKNNEIVEGKYTEDLKLLYDSDEMKSNDEELEGLEHWYGNTFYAYGVNKVKNLRDQNIKLNRKVFFINKIVVE